ncbi:MAG: CotH kinase family protein [Saprospiraceae bacterium]|nr:CotH kinase family protein [Saprospiraceae bacterium]
MKQFITLLFTVMALTSEAQSFYDLYEIQEIKIYFSQPDWDYQMDTAKAGTEGYTLADSVVVNGETFVNCGVKYKGNSSYDANRAKNPLHIELDYEEDTDYHGFTDIKLGNGWSDNSMIREPLSYAILRQYMAAPLSNFAKIYINDDYYGLMNNSENIDKRFVLDRFFTSKYGFFKCNPGSSLHYLGSTPSIYAGKYELKSDTGWYELIQLCDTLNNHFDAFEQIADVDRFIWMLAFNNVMVNLDSYSGSFRQNYYLYRDHNGQWLPIVWDLNMAMGGFSIAGGNTGAIAVANMPTMSHTLHKSEAGWPLIYKLLNNPFYSKMYFAHLRTINNENFANGQYKALANELHDLVDAEVQNDPNHLSTYDNFSLSLTTNTSTGSGGTSPGIFPLMDARASYLSNVLSAAPPVITNVGVEGASAYGETAHVVATVSNLNGAYLSYRYQKAGKFVRAAMSDDGQHGDGAANDGVFGADLPLLSLDVQYFIYAENSNTGAFSPERAAYEFYSFTPAIAIAEQGDIAINELTANNEEGIENERGKVRDWVEVYNKTNEPLGLSGLYLAEEEAELAKWQFPATAFIEPHGHLLIWADDLDEELVEHHTNFDLSSLGGSLYLSDGATVFDETNFAEQGENIAWGRCPDGGGDFAETTERTPRAANVCVSAAGEALGMPNVQIVPNPASDVLYLWAERSIISAEMYASDGCLCLKTSQPSSLEIAGLTSGTYWLKLIFEDGQFTVKQLIKV